MATSQRRDEPIARSPYPPPLVLGWRFRSLPLRHRPLARGDRHRSSLPSPNLVAVQIDSEVIVTAVDLDVPVARQSGMRWVFHPDPALVVHIPLLPPFSPLPDLIF